MSERRERKQLVSRGDKGEKLNESMPMISRSLSARLPTTRMYIDQRFSLSRCLFWASMKLPKVN